MRHSRFGGWLGERSFARRHRHSLTPGVAGYPIGFLLAIGLTLFQLAHFAMRERSITAFPVQVRFGYLMFLLVALPEPMQILYWVPVVGTWAQLIFGYCTMARCVSLLPWNRDERFLTSITTSVSAMVLAASLLAEIMWPGNHWMVMGIGAGKRQL